MERDGEAKRGSNLSPIHSIPSILFHFISRSRTAVQASGAPNHTPLSPTFAPPTPFSPQSLSPGGSLSYAGAGVWGISKTALINNATTVPTFSWFFPYSKTYSFTIQPAKTSETGKMHLMASYSNTYMQVNDDARRTKSGGNGEREGVAGAADAA